MPVARTDFATADSAAAACARYILEQLRPAGPRTLAISGGKSPAAMFRELARTGCDWSHVHLFWVDERAVPATDPQSNYRLARELFLEPAGFPASNVHRIATELGPQAAAGRYQAELLEFFGGTPAFDVVHRGMGPEAHTASLFPGEALIGNRDDLAAAVWVEKMGTWRVTMLPSVLLSAKSTAMLATGADKVYALADVFGKPYDPTVYPAQLAAQAAGEMAWFVSM